jgi:uncharacterized protein DUF3618
VDQGTREGGPPVGDEATQVSEQRSPEEIRRDIEETRAELGDTVEALAAKTDVKGQAKAKAEEVKRSAQARKDEFVSKAKSAAPESAGGAAQQVTGAAKSNTVPLGIAGAFAAGFLLGRLTSR